MKARTSPARPRRRSRPRLRLCTGFRGRGRGRGGSRNLAFLIQDSFVNTAMLVTAVWLGGVCFSNAQTNTTPTVEETKPATGFKPLAPGEYNNWLELGM